MIRKMDRRLIQAFNRMIDQKKQKARAVLNGECPEIDDSWMLLIFSLSKDFKSLADPDALAAIPVLAAICDSKMAEVQAMDISEDLKDEILYEISKNRKQIGIDARLSGSLGNSDVW